MRRKRMWQAGLVALLCAGGVAVAVPMASAEVSSAAWVHCDYPAQYLKLGCKGSDVKVVQKLLTCVGLKVKVDGLYGAATRDAVMTFQKKVGLAVDGVVGPNTWNALHKYC